MDSLTNHADMPQVPEIVPAPQGLLARGNRRRQMAILLSAFALLVAVVVAAGYLVFENRQAGDNMLRSQQIVASLAQLLSMAQDAETGQRGYLLAGDPIYLAPYYNAVEKIGPGLKTLERLTFDNPRQQAEMPRLRSIFDAKLSEHDATPSP